jgi:hypothetical protein
VCVCVCVCVCVYEIDNLQLSGCRFVDENSALLRTVIDDLMLKTVMLCNLMNNHSMI